MIRDAYRAAFYGKPGPCLVDLPANLILGQFEGLEQEAEGGGRRAGRLVDGPKGCAPRESVRKVVEALRGARRPLVVVGKGAAYARSEGAVRRLVDRFVFLLLLSCSWFLFLPVFLSGRVFGLGENIGIWVRLIYGSVWG